MEMIYINNLSLKGKPNIASTHPWMIKFLNNIEDGYNYSHGSSKNIEFRCPSCTNTFTRRINIVSRNGFHCKYCGDKVSIGEKIVFEVLKQIDENIEKEKIFEWASNKRYDFYSHEYNFICEVHGSQHFQEEFSRMKNSRRTFDEEKNNDILKCNLASENGFDINSYIVIDAKQQNINYIKNSIEASLLKNYICFESFDWNIIFEKLINYDCKIIYEYYNIHKCSAKTISKELGIDERRVLRCLKIATEAGLCSYDSNNFMNNFDKRFFEDNYGSKILELKTNNKELSTIEIANILNIHSDTVRKYLKKYNIYDKTEEMKNKFKAISNSNTKYDVLVYSIDKEFIKRYSSFKELEEMSEIDFGVKLFAKGVNKACSKNNHKYKGLLFYKQLKKDC